MPTLRGNDCNSLIIFEHTVPALRGKDYGKTKMRYPDYNETQSGLQYKVTNTIAYITSSIVFFMYRLHWILTESDKTCRI